MFQGVPLISNAYNVSLFNFSVYPFIHPLHGTGHHAYSKVKMGNNKFAGIVTEVEPPEKCTIGIGQKVE